MAVRHLWRRYFQRSDLFSEAVEKAVEEQAAFERTHVALFDADIRYKALLQRAMRHAGGKLDAKSITMLQDAAYDWQRAVVAAEETP